MRGRDRKAAALMNCKSMPPSRQELKIWLGWEHLIKEQETGVSFLPGTSGKVSILGMWAQNPSPPTDLVKV